MPGTVLADRLAKIAPTGEGSRSFFVTGGSEAVETALKVAKSYQRKRGFPGRYKAISRRYAQALLEHLDATRLTRRLPDDRRVLRRAAGR